MDCRSPLYCKLQFPARLIIAGIGVGTVLAFFHLLPALGVVLTAFLAAGILTWRVFACTLEDTVFSRDTEVPREPLPSEILAPEPEPEPNADDMSDAGVHIVKTDRQYSRLFGASKAFVSMERKDDGTFLMRAWGISPQRIINYREAYEQWMKECIGRFEKATGEQLAVSSSLNPHTGKIQYVMARK